MIAPYAPLTFILSPKRLCHNVITRGFNDRSNLMGS